MNDERNLAPVNPPLEVDGRFVCWRCRCDLDEDMHCSACGVVSIPPSRRPRTTGRRLESAAFRVEHLGVGEWPVIERRTA